MSTYRERRLAKAERLREWSEAREAKQAALSEAARGDEAATGIPFGQPILVGHHSERRHRRAIERMNRAMAASVDNSQKAERMAERADNIEAQAANAIYSDDPDAIERLREKIEEMEAERARIKAYNASCRKAAKDGGTGDLSILTEPERESLLSTAKACPYQIGKGGSAPSYWLTNLGGNISRQRKRLAHLEAEAARPADDRGRGRVMEARYGGECADCGATVERGDTMTYYRRTREVVCAACEEG